MTKKIQIGILILTLSFFCYLSYFNIKSLMQLNNIENNKVSVIGKVTDKYKGLRLIEGYVLSYNYSSIDGISINQESRVSPAFWNQKKVGDTVQIVYNSEFINVSKINSKHDVKNRDYLFQVILMIIGAIMSLYFVIKRTKAST